MTVCSFSYLEPGQPAPKIFTADDALREDAERCAGSAGEATEVLARRLGEACRRGSPITLAEFGRDVVVADPATGAQVRVYADGSSIQPPEARKILDRIALHLGLQSFGHAHILANALLVDTPNRPTLGFFAAAKLVGRRPGRDVDLERLAFWSKEVDRVHQWFLLLEKEHPREDRSEN